MTKDVGYDALEQDLRAALAEDAAAIAPGEALGSILARTADEPPVRDTDLRGLRGPRGLRDLRVLGDLRRGGAWPSVRWSPAVFAGAAAAAVVAVVAWAGVGHSPAPFSPGGPTQPVATSAPTGSASATSAPTRSASATSAPSAPSTGASGTTSASAGQGGRAIPVYYVTEVSGAGPRLVREFFPSSTDSAEAAAAAALRLLSAQRPADPDYVSLWPSSIELRLTVSGSLATVDATSWPTNLGSGYESLAVEQVVYTVTAADPALTSVLFRVNGAIPPSGHLDLTAAVGRGSAFSTVADVWILEPLQDATVGSPVAVSVYGTAYEGATTLKVFRGATEVWSGTVTTAMGQYAQASTTVDLPAGAYELRAYTGNGKDATVTLWDTKTFTVH